MKKNEHISVIHIITSPTGGGAEVLVRALNEKLRDYDIKSEALYFTQADTTLQSNEMCLQSHYKNPLTIFKIRRLLKQRIQQTNNLLIHTHLTWPFFYLVFANIGLNIKLVFTEHSTFNRRRTIPFFKYIERFFYQKYASIICISEGVQQSLFDWLGKTIYQKTAIIKNGARLYKLKQPHNLANPIRFISIGSLNTRKNFSSTIAALKKLSEKNWTYTIVGEGPERHNLTALIEQLELTSQVKLVGWSSEVEQHLLQSDIQLIPSLWEGFGLVAVEGMSTGISVVASNVDGLREVLNENNPAVFLVDQFENPDSWVQKIERCIDKLKTSHELMAKAARKQAEQFSIDNMVEEYSKLYKKLLNR